jgi:hypothetical protein
MKHWDDIDDGSKVRWPWIVLCTVLGLALLYSCFGCTHAQPTPEEVIPCIPFVVQAPLIVIPEHPALTSAGWTEEQVRAHPIDFARAVATDLTAWIGWGLGLEADVEASNTARPEP